MKKIMAMLLALVMVIGLVACGEKAPDPTEAPTDAIVDATEEAIEATEPHVDETEPPVDETEPASTEVQVVNPWVEYETIDDAEDACGIAFPIPLVVDDKYNAESFRVMDNKILEVTYRYEDSEVIVRMCEGEDQDISGVFENLEVLTKTTIKENINMSLKIGDNGILQLISAYGYSYSLYAPNHYVGEANGHFLEYIYQQ